MGVALCKPHTRFLNPTKKNPRGSQQKTNQTNTPGASSRLLFLRMSGPVLRSCLDLFGGTLFWVPLTPDCFNRNTTSFLSVSNGLSFLDRHPGLQLGSVGVISYSPRRRVFLAEIVSTLLPQLHCPGEDSPF